MKANMGTADRIIRAIVGIAALAAGAFGLLDGTLAIVAIVVGVALLVTAAIRRCPPYALFGINTGARDG